MISYCLPLVCSRCDDVSEALHKHHASYDFLEVWLDTLTDYSDAFLEHLLATYPDRLMLLFRRPKLEPIHMTLEQRFQIMTRMDQSSSILDLDVLTQGEEVDFYRQKNFTHRWIGSYHNYERTPSSEELRDIVSRISSSDPWVIKLATYCNSPSDAVRLLDLGLSLKEKGKRCIVLGMGPHGAVTRTYGTLWYNEMIFAPPQLEGATAPGQLTRPELEELLSSLSN